MRRIVRKAWAVRRSKSSWPSSFLRLAGLMTVVLLCVAWAFSTRFMVCIARGRSYGVVLRDGCISVAWDHEWKGMTAALRHWQWRGVHEHPFDPGFKWPGLADVSGMLVMDLPIWMLVTIAGAPTAFAWLRYWRGPAEPSTAPSCPACGYCLVGNVSGLCPECGCAVPGDDAKRAQRLRQHDD